MKKLSLFSIICTLLAVGFTSCEETPEVSTITKVIPFTVSGPALVITGDEKNRTLSVPFTISDEQIVGTTLAISIDEENTTATEGVDFDLDDTEVTVDGFVNEGVIHVTIYEDYDVEGPESIFLKVGPTVPTGVNPYVVANEITIEVRIDDITDNDLRISLDWNDSYAVDVLVTGTAEYGGPFDLLTGEEIVDGPQTLNGCQFADMDFIIVDDEFASFYGSVSAQTGACPEVLTFPGSGVITNGTEEEEAFYIFSDLYLNWGSSEFVNAPFPLLINGLFEKQNVTMGTWTQDPTLAYPSNLEGGLGSQATWTPILFVERSNGVWTITEDDVVFTARQMQQLSDLIGESRALKNYK